MVTFTMTTANVFSVNILVNRQIEDVFDPATHVYVSVNTRNLKSFVPRIYFILNRSGLNISLLYNYLFTHLTPTQNNCCVAALGWLRHDYNIHNSNIHINIQSPTILTNTTTTNVPMQGAYIAQNSRPLCPCGP